MGSCLIGTELGSWTIEVLDLCVKITMDICICNSNMPMILDVSERDKKETIVVVYKLCIDITILPRPHYFHSIILSQLTLGQVESEDGTKQSLVH